MLYASEKQLPKEMTLPLLKQMAEKEEKAVVHGAVHVIQGNGGRFLCHAADGCRVVAVCL